MRGCNKLINPSQPGEYGNKQKPSGWVVITDMSLGKQRIFVASKSFREFLSCHYGIPEENIVNLIESKPGTRHGIPEEPLSGAEGLRLFTQRLLKVANTKNDILIHCQQGQNRSPVAAVIYLINKGVEAERAMALVTNAFRAQRDANFILNEKGHYSAVLEYAAALQENNILRVM